MTPPLLSLPCTGGAGFNKNPRILPSPGQESWMKSLQLGTKPLSSIRSCEWGWSLAGEMELSWSGLVVCHGQAGFGIRDAPALGIMNLLMNLGSLMSCCLCTGLAGGAAPAQLTPGAARAWRMALEICQCCLTLLSAR